MICKQRQHLPGASAIEQKIRIGHQQEIVLRLQFQGVQVVCFRRRPVTQPFRILGDQSLDPGSVACGSSLDRGVGLDKKRQSLARLAGVGSQVPEAGQPRFDTRIVGDSGAVPIGRRVVALYHVEGREDQPSLSIPRIQFEGFLQQGRVHR